MAKLDAEKEYKMVVMGGGGVGKSALTIRLISGNFLDEYDPTIEDSYRKTVEIDGAPVTLDILDTAGQDEFAAMRDLWIREAKGFLLVYAITWTSSFQQIQEMFQKIHRIKEDELNQVAIVLAGNKCDLADSRTVTMEQGQALIEQWRKEGVSAAFFETSAKAQINNEECYFEIVRQLRKKENMINVEVETDDKPPMACCTML